MTLDIIGSSSSGNCYVLHNDTEALIIEAGCKFDKVLQAVKFNRGIFKGAVISHCHSDHAKEVASLQKWNIPYIATADVSGVHTPFKAKGVVKFGNFTIDYFTVRHNVDCKGFLIKHPDLGKLLFITDAQEIPYRFQGLNFIMCETNYDRELWERYPERRHGNMNHMEIDDAIGGVMMQDLSVCRHIILLHLSDGLSNATDFKRRMERATGIPTTVADKGMKIEL